MFEKGDDLATGNVLLLCRKGLAGRTLFDAFTDFTVIGKAIHGGDFGHFGLQDVGRGDEEGRDLSEGVVSKENLPRGKTNFVDAVLDENITLQAADLSR